MVEPWRDSGEEERGGVEERRGGGRERRRSLKKKKKRVSVPLTSSDVMLMQICPAGCERRRGRGGGGEGCRKETPRR